MKRKRYSDETKARAAADLASGLTVEQTAEQHDMPRSTAGDLSPTSKRGAVKVRKIADLNALQAVFLEQLAHNMAALRALTDLIREDTAFAAEHGDSLAVLYGVLFDKTGKLAGAAVARSEMDRPALPDVGANELTSAPAVEPDSPS